MLLILKQVALAILEFISKYWKQIVILAMLVTFGTIMRGCGYEEADAKWVKYHNEQVELLNAKVTRIETESRTEATRLRAEAEASQWALKALAASFPPILAKTPTGEALMCNNKPVQIYLGRDFTEAWNKLGEAGGLK